MMATGTCAICGKRITNCFFVCRGCEILHGLGRKYRTWPVWVKCLVTSHHRERRLEARIRASETDEDVMFYLDPGECSFLASIDC